MLDETMSKLEHFHLLLESQLEHFHLLMEKDKIQDWDAEYLSFPNVYCNKHMNPPTLGGTKIHYSDLCKRKVRTVERRAKSNILISCQSKESTHQISSR